VLALDNLLGLVLLVVPADRNVVAAVESELVAATARGILEEPSEVLLLDKLVNVGGLVLVIDAALPSVALDIGHLVYAQGVLLVQSDVIELAGGGGGLAGRRVLNKSEPAKSV
jgi:hypothetical protein